jgi:hypothetical protein
MNGLHSADSIGSKGQVVLEKILGLKYEKCNPKDGDGYFIGKSGKFTYEIKTTDQALDSTKGINQVRPIKCIAVLVYFKSIGIWAFLSPKDVFKLSLSKNRGQHNECVVECTQISINSIPKSCICSSDNLIEKLENMCSYFNSQDYKNLKKECDIILDQLKAMNQNTKKTIEAMVKS